MNDLTARELAEAAKTLERAQKNLGAVVVLLSREAAELEYVEKLIKPYPPD